MPLTPKLIDLAWAAMIGGLGGIAHNLLLVFRGERFSLWLFCVNVVLAGFCGWLIGEFLPADVTARDGIIGISGFSAIKILEFVEAQGVVGLLKLLNPKK